MSTGPSLYYDGFVSYEFPKIPFCLMQISDKIVADMFRITIDPEDIWKISDKIESLENRNWRTRHSTNLVQCSFTWLSNSLETHFFWDFILYVSTFRLFSYFVWLEWPCVVGRRIRLKIGNNVIEKKTHSSI